MSQQERQITRLLIWFGNAMFGMAVIAIIGLTMFSGRVEYPAGTAVAAKPVQHTYLLPAAGRQLDEYTIRPVAEFRIEALVLSTKHYFWRSDSKLSEVDLALGWGPMSNDAVLSELRIWQSGRWYYYRWQDQPPISPGDIRRHSTNLHTVPANEDVRRQLRNIRAGQVVSLEGELINISRADGWHWNSSTSRTDSGNGACELMWVESVVISEG
jgi:hypothetical protein